MVSDETLVAHAISARAHAHAPWSNFRVGAAVLTATGAIVGGCNVEISSYSLTCCAERVAVFTAISQGETRLRAVAVVTEADPPASPCGACRQVLHDFGGPDLRVIIADHLGRIHHITDLGALLPLAFGPQDLTRAGGMQDR